VVLAWATENIVNRCNIRMRPLPVLKPIFIVYTLQLAFGLIPEPRNPAIDQVRINRLTGIHFSFFHSLENQYIPVKQLSINDIECV
jgi:hypothetical protein